MRELFSVAIVDAQARAMGASTYHVLDGTYVVHMQLTQLYPSINLIYHHSPHE